MARIGLVPKLVSTRLALYVLLPTAALLLGGGATALITLEQQLERRLQQEVAMVARSLQEPVSHAFERGRVGSLRSALSSPIRIGRIHSANVFDDRGEVLAAMGPSELSVDRDTVRRFARDRRGGGAYSHARGEPVFAYFVPVRIEAGSDRAGLLQVTRRRDDIEDRMDELRRAGIGGFLVLMTLLGLLVVVGYREAIGSALAQIHSSIARIADGEVEHRAPVRGPLEVRRVAERFNQMLDALQQAEARARLERQRRNELKLRLAAYERLAALGELAGGIAHELGTPLAAAVGRLQRARTVDGVPTRAEYELERADRELTRVQQMVRDVLSFGRDGAHRKDRVRVLAVARRAIDTVREESWAAVEWTLDGDDLAVDGDAARLELALTNLCRNAAQSEGVGAVSLECLAEGGEVVVAVTDDGAGLDPALRDRVFHPFFTTRRQGTGLGLAIVAAVAREHDGSTHAEPAERGARFSLRLPPSTGSANA